jgi:hypothetical protein
MTRSAARDDLFGSGSTEAKDVAKAPEPLSSQIGRISSGPFEISPASFGPVSGDAPSSGFVENTTERGRAVMPLSTIVGIGGGIFVVLVALSLLLFR